MIPVLLVAGAAALLIGYWLGTRRLDERAYEQGRAQLLEFVRIADSLGAIDRERLAALTADSGDSGDCPPTRR